MADIPPLGTLSLSGSDEDILLGQTLSLSLEDTEESFAKSHLNRSSAFRHEFTPRTSSPLKSSLVSSSDDLLSDGAIPEDSDIVMEDDDEELEDHNTSFSSQIVRKPSMMLNPTILGAKVATHGSPIQPYIPRVNLVPKPQDAANEEDEDTELSDDLSISTTSQSSPIRSYVKNRSSKQPSNLSYEQSVSEVEDSENTTPNDSSFDSSLQTSTPSKHLLLQNRPIQFQIHHHHYPASPQSSFLTDDYDDTADDSILPAPWSKIAEPKAPTPYIISSYLQLLFNAITSSVAIYILISAIKTVRSDINYKMEEYAQQMAMEVSLCARNYIENKCHPDTRVVGMEELCVGWERCMNRDPALVASKASVSAETLGLILNSLIEPIGAKAIVVFVLGFVAWSFTSNFVFGFVRAKSYYGWGNGSHQNNNAQTIHPGQQTNLLRYTSVPMDNQQIAYH